MLEIQLTVHCVVLQNLRNNKIPIINYAIEEHDKYRVFNEHKSLIERLNSGVK